MFGFLKKKTEESDAPVPVDEAKLDVPDPAAVQDQPLKPPVVPLPETPVEIPSASNSSSAVVINEKAGDPIAARELEIVVPPRQAPDTILAEFVQEIDRQEDRLYGVALFFECVSLLHTGQTGVIDTNRKQFRNIIVAGHASVGQARALVEKARKDPLAINAIRAFRFTFCEGHPNPIGLSARADALLKAYRRLYPDRPLDKAFTEEETYRLLEAASGIMSPVLDAK